MKRLGTALSIGALAFLAAAPTASLLATPSDAANADAFCVKAVNADNNVSVTGNCVIGNSPLPENPGSGGSENQTPKERTDETIVGWASQNIGSIADDEASLGAKNGMLSTYVDFANNSSFPHDFVSEAAKRDAVLLIAWEPWNWDADHLNQPDFHPNKVAAGDYDDYMIEWLREAEKQNAKTPILVRFAPEMNDAVRPWSIGTNGGVTGDDYIAMWRHVYELKEAYAPSISLMWNPLVDGSDPSGEATTLAEAFPGESFVDMTALDGFNWGQVQNPKDGCGWQSYNDIFGAPVAELKKLAPSKPWGIAETASVSMDESNFQEGGACGSAWSWVYDWPESGDFYKTPQDWITQAGWTKTMIQNANKDGAFFVNMFNVQKETDWRLQSTDLGKSVFGDVKATSPVKTGEDGVAGYFR